MTINEVEDARSKLEAIGLIKTLVKEGNVNNYIYENCLCDFIVLRPFKRNERAVKCYEKSGFEIVDEYVGSDTLGNKEKMIVLLNKPNN